MAATTTGEWRGVERCRGCGQALYDTEGDWCAHCDTDADDGCCALAEGHDGACAWICSDCHGTTHCWACGGPSGDDLGNGCGECDGTGHCFGCYEGMVSDVL